jgi:hypothetical protein
MKDVRRPLLIGGACLLGAGLGLYFAPALRHLAPWLVLAGVLCLALYFVLRKLAAVPEQRDGNSMLFKDGATTLQELPDREDMKR